MRLVKDKGASIAQAVRDLDVHGNVLRKWVLELQLYPQQAFPGKGVMESCLYTQILCSNSYKFGTDREDGRFVPDQPSYATTSGICTSRV